MQYIGSTCSVLWVGRYLGDRRCGSFVSSTAGSVQTWGPHGLAKWYSGTVWWFDFHHPVKIIRKYLVMHCGSTLFLKKNLDNIEDFDFLNWLLEQLTCILKTNIQFYKENAYFLYMECSNWEIWMTLNRDKLDFDSSVIFCLVRFWPILLTFFLQIQFMQNFVRKKNYKCFSHY